MNHSHTFFWYPTAHEDGWKCCSCDHRPGEPPGFDPRRDRDDIHGKVYMVLDAMHDAKLVYVSNGSMGDSITAAVADRCRKVDRYDQETIILFITRALGGSHARYWAKVSRGVLAGTDPRHRCPCGKLATMSTWSNSEDVRRCSDCYSLPDLAGSTP